MGKRKRHKKIVNALPYVITFTVGVLCSYFYFTLSDHIYEVHEYDHDITYKTIFRHYREGCENFGTDSGE